MKYKIDKENCLLKDLKIPIGNMLTFSEVAKIVETEKPKEIYQLLKYSWIWINFKGKIKAAGFHFDGSGFQVSGNYIYILGRSHGIFVERKSKQVKK